MTIAKKTVTLCAFLSIMLSSLASAITSEHQIRQEKLLRRYLTTLLQTHKYTIECYAPTGDFMKEKKYQSMLAPDIDDSTAKIFNTRTLISEAITTMLDSQKNLERSPLDNAQARLTKISEEISYFQKINDDCEFSFIINPNTYSKKIIYRYADTSSKIAFFIALTFYNLRGTTDILTEMHLSWRYLFEGSGKEIMVQNKFPRWGQTFPSERIIMDDANVTIETISYSRRPTLRMGIPPVVWGEAYPAWWIRRSNIPRFMTYFFTGFISIAKLIGRPTGYLWGTVIQRPNPPILKETQPEISPAQTSKEENQTTAGGGGSMGMKEEMREEQTQQ